MKKHIAKTISILSLFLALSAGAVNVSAFPGGACSVPSCWPRPTYAVSASAPDVTPASAQDPAGQETVPSAPPEDSFSFAFFLVPWALTFLYLP
jgi:hypothetical protein